MNKEGLYFRVGRDPYAAPLADHLLHGYEDEREFLVAVRSLLGRWCGRVGECTEERNGFLLLRFHDTPGGMCDEAWLPDYLLKPVDNPSDGSKRDLSDDSLDGAFGFD